MNAFPWLLLLLSISVSAQELPTAGDCPEILLDQNDPAFQGVPIWNQGATPSCYLYSSSFMASVWARKHWPVRQDFVVDPAFAYDQLMRSNKEIKEPILDAENGRTCMSLRWLLKGIERKILQTSRNSSSSLKQPECRMFGFERIQDHQNLKSPLEFKNRMKTLIAQKEFFSIEYCSGVLSDPGKEHIKNRIFDSTLTYLNSPEKTRNFENSCGFHVSVVVGQAMRDGKCQARIRNSWGKSNGENGYNWVDLEALSKNTLRVITLD